MTVQKKKKKQRKTYEEWVTELRIKYNITSESKYVIERYIYGKCVSHAEANSFEEARTVYRNGFSFNNIATIAYIDGTRVLHKDAWHLFLGKLNFYLP